MATLLYTSLLTLIMSFPVVSATLGLNRSCIELTVPVQVFANNTKYDVVRVDSNIDAVEFTRNRDKWDALSPDKLAFGPIVVGGDFDISALLCVPTDSNKGKNILMIATHGVGFDKHEFDPSYRPEEFSFVNAALAAGYAVLAYDRLGAGLSSLPDAYDELQTPLQGEVLRALTELALDGNIIENSHKLPEDTDITSYKADKVVHVGHSYGSIITNWFLGQHGSLSAGAILTGFLIGSETSALKIEVADLAFAPEYNPSKFGNRTSGYLAFGTANAFQLDSFKKETLDPEILHYWNSTLQSTLGIGELLTLGTGVGEIVKGFTGPLQMFTGEFDYAFCDGVCPGTFDISQLSALYPDAADFDVYLQPNTGHVVQLSLNATAGYQVNFNFLEKNGL